MGIVLLIHGGGGEVMIVGVGVGCQGDRSRRTAMEEWGVMDNHLSSGFQDIGAGNGYHKSYGGPIIIVIEAPLIFVEGVCLYVDEDFSFCRQLEVLPGDCVPDVAERLKATEDDCVSTEDYAFSPYTGADGDAVLDSSLDVFRANIQDIRVMDPHTSTVIPLVVVTGIIKDSRWDFISAGVINRVRVEPPGLAGGKTVTTSIEYWGQGVWGWWDVMGMGGRWVVVKDRVEAEGTRYVLKFW